MTADITAPEAVRTLWVVRDRVRFLGGIGGADANLVEVEVPPGSGTPPHRHASPELFRILEGEITFGFFEPGQPPREAKAGPGAVVRVSGWAAHNYTNAGETPARMMVLLDGSMVGFFEDLGREEAPEAGPPSEAEIGAVLAACGRHGIEVLAGPPPA